MKANADRIACALIVMAMLVFVGCATTGEQMGAQEAGPTQGAGLAPEERGTIYSIAYNVWENQVQINAPGKPEEIIKTKSARVDFEDGRATLTTGDRKLQFVISGRSNRKATKDLTVVAAEFDGKWDNIILVFANGKKKKHTQQFISISPKLDIIEVRQYAQGSIAWEEFYGR